MPDNFDPMTGQPLTVPGAAAPSTATDAPTAPAIAREDEPVLLIDLTPSMDRPNAAGSTITRFGLVREAIPLFVKMLEGDDPEAAAEAASGEGGLNAFGFSWVSKAGPNAWSYGDLNSGNMNDHPAADGSGRTIPGKLAQLTLRGQATSIMPGYQLVKNTLIGEFGTKGLEKKCVKILLLTDGEADDTQQFSDALEADCGPGWMVEVAILGHGMEHDAALSAYQGVADRHPQYVRVVSFGTMTEPEDVAAALRQMAG